MKKRILTLLLSLAILVTFMPTMAFATENQLGRSYDDFRVAKIEYEDGSTAYAPTLWLAFTYYFEANCEITLLKDVDLIMPVLMNGDNAGDEATLNLNGHTINSGYWPIAIQVLHEGKLTIDGTKAGSKIIGSVIAGNPMAYFNEEEIGEYDVADVVINGGTYESKHPLFPTLAAYNNEYFADDESWYSSVTVNNATVTKECEPFVEENPYSYEELQGMEKGIYADILEEEEFANLPENPFEEGSIMEPMFDVYWLSSSERETSFAPAIEIAGAAEGVVNNSSITESITSDNKSYSLMKDGFQGDDGFYGAAYAVNVDWSQFIMNNTKIDSTDGGINGLQGSLIVVDGNSDSELPESEIYADKVYKAINLGRYTPLVNMFVSGIGMGISDTSYAEVHGGKFVVRDDNDSEFLEKYLESPYGLEDRLSILSEAGVKYFRNYFEKGLDDVFFFNEGIDGCRIRVYGGSFSKLPLKATFGDGSEKNGNVEIKLLGEQSISKLDCGRVNQLEVKDNSVLATILTLLWGDEGEIVDPVENPVTKSVSALYDFDKLPAGVSVVVGEGANLNLDANEEFKYYNLTHSKGWIEKYGDFDYNDFYEAAGEKFPLHIIKDIIPSTILPPEILANLNISDVVKEEKTTLADILEANGTKLLVENGGTLTINGNEVSNVYQAAKNSIYSLKFNEGKYDLVVEQGTVNVNASKSGLFEKKGDLDRAVNFTVNQKTTLCVPSGKNFTLSKGSTLEGKGEVLVNGEMHVVDTAAVNGTIVVNGKLYVDDNNVASTFKVNCNKGGSVINSEGVDVSSAYTSETPQGDPQGGGSGSGSGGGTGGGTTESGQTEKTPAEKLADVKTSAEKEIDKLVAGIELTDSVKGLIYDGKKAISAAKTEAEVNSTLVDALAKIKAQLEKEMTLTVKAKKLSKNRIKLSWSAIRGADSYRVYAARAGKTLKRVATVSGKSYTIKKASGKKLVKGTKYKFKIVAVKDGKELVKSSNKVVKR